LIIDNVSVFQLKLPLKKPFITGFGRIENKDIIIVSLKSNGFVGWGEASTLYAPIYNHEDVFTAWHVITDLLIPRILKKDIDINFLEKLFSEIKGHNIAKMGLESAFWDLKSKMNNKPLFKLFGGRKKEIKCGVSIGISKNPAEVLEKIRIAQAKNYHRFKIKIKPGNDKELISLIRKEFGDIPLMCDANSSYSFNNINELIELDDYNLMMIEQPLSHDDIINHSFLQKKIKTPICLDESITSLDKCEKAIKLKALKILNIKPGRMGGLNVSKKVHDLCMKKEIPVWMGGMLESGIGKAHLLHFSTLPNFKIVGDIGPQNYLKEDIIEPKITMSEEGMISLPETPGIGFSINMKNLKKFCVKHFTASK